MDIPLGPEMEPRPAIEFYCARCSKKVEICRSCWRNQKYCSPECSRQAHLERHRLAQKSYNDTEAGGNEKGRVEDLIKYIRMNFWPGRSFENFDDLIKQSIVWRNQVANQREHRST